MRNITNLRLWKTAGLYSVSLSLALLLPVNQLTAQSVDGRPLPRSGSTEAQSTYYGTLVIVGVQNRVFSTGNQANGVSDAGLDDFVYITPCTRLAIPVLTGWELGYGTISPAHPAENFDFGWNSGDRDRWLGRARIDLSVIGYPVVAGRRQARIRVRARLSDADGADRWWGIIRYQVLLLGPSTC